MDIKGPVKDYIVEHFLMGSGAQDLQADTSLLEQNILDSTGVLELVAHLEQSYGIQVSDDELLPENLDSLSAIEAFVARKQAGSG